MDAPQMVPSQHSLGALHASPSRRQHRLPLHEYVLKQSVGAAHGAPGPPKQKPTSHTS
jgi:hypothetical protein